MEFISQIHEKYNLTKDYRLVITSDPNDKGEVDAIFFNHNNVVAHRCITVEDADKFVYPLNFVS